MGVGGGWRRMEGVAWLDLWKELDGGGGVWVGKGGLAGGWRVAGIEPHLTGNSNT